MKTLPYSMFAPILSLMLGLIAATSLSAPLPPAVPPPPVRVEPGLEDAVKWKWWVQPSADADWGLPIPKSDKAAAAPPGAAPAANAGPRPATYEVQRGDALAKIGRRFGMSADQLKAFNNLSSDVIHVGDVLKIPTLIELAMMAPAPEEKPAPSSPSTTGKPGEAKSTATAAAPHMPGPMLTSEAKSEFGTVLLQVYLDRKQFATGPIDGHGGPVFKKILELYLAGHPEAADPEALRETARAELGNPYTSYRLKAEDFAFIAMLQNAPQPPRKKGVKAVEPPVSDEQLVAGPMLAYRSPWEFVAERFHCEEGFLRKLNSKIANFPSVGTELLVPNVLPFEIEKMYEGPLQPPADPQNPTVAAVVELARLEISRGDKLVAVMPLGLARPDLRGRGSWAILDAIPKPRLATLQEIKEQPKKKPLSSFAPDVSTPQAPPPPAPGPALSSEQYLHCGPNNPIGVVWINLAKANSTEPLPYGLHGTSIPERMRSQEGIGGIRLANWDIARAVRLLPPGTPLKWR